MTREATMWNSISAGTFVNDYTKSLKDYRTGLQKAIDRNATVVRITKKKDIEEGDIRMYDGKGWAPLCLHTAEKVFNDEGCYIALQQLRNGQWIDIDSDKFNRSLHRQPLRPVETSLFPDLSEEEQNNQYFKESHKAYARER